MIFSVITAGNSSAFAAETVQADLNNDGVLDLKGYFNSNTLSRTELDRNQDGQPDVWMVFAGAKALWDTRADYDDDFDGRVDSVYFLKSDAPVRTLLDENGDGLLEEEISYQEGQPMGKKKLEPPVDPKNLK
jgi:hypothetical protein